MIISTLLGWRKVAEKNAIPIVECVAFLRAKLLQEIFIVNYFGLDLIDQN